MIFTEVCPPAHSLQCVVNEKEFVWNRGMSVIEEELNVISSLPHPLPSLVFLSLSLACSPSVICLTLMPESVCMWMHVFMCVYECRVSMSLCA